MLILTAPFRVPRNGGGRFYQLFCESQAGVGLNIKRDETLFWATEQISGFHREGGSQHLQMKVLWEMVAVESG